MGSNALENPENEERPHQWRDTQIELSEIYFKIVKDKKRRPKVKELAEASGFSERHIFRHLKFIQNMDFKRRYRDASLMTDRVIFALANQAMMGGPGSAAAAKLYLQIVEGFGEAKERESNPLRKLSGEELEKKLEQMSGVLDGKVLKFVRKSSGRGRDNDGTDGQSVRT